MINETDPRDKWFIQRHGRFTASNIYKLVLSNGTTMFTPGGWNYIQEKAIETMTVLYERPELEFVEPLMHGKTYEEAAFNEYVRVTKNYSMRHFGDECPVYIEFNEYSGGSPDGLMGEGATIYKGLELKCPHNSKNHFNYMKMQSQWDLKEKKPEYYAQIQFLMLITGAVSWDFGSFDERWRDVDKRLKVIEVLPDKKFTDHLQVKIEMAQKEKLKIMQSF